MRIIYENSEEHHGNDSWVVNIVSIFYEDGDLIFRHRHKVDGSWFDPIRETYEKVLSYDVEKAQEQIDEYLKGDLDEYFQINLQEILSPEE
jgi:hypothetical protein